MFPVELFRATLSEFTAILQRYEIRFHLTGGIAGTVYGEPRLTQVIDIVIDPAALTRPWSASRRDSG